MTTDPTFKTTKRLADDVDMLIDCTTEFALSDPADTISTATWAVDYGSVTLSNQRVVAPNKAIVRVAGGGKMYSWHGIRATITCVSGQVYTPLIRIQIIR
jgi:hypothetical protein